MQMPSIPSILDDRYRTARLHVLQAARVAANFEIKPSEISLNVIYSNALRVSGLKFPDLLEGSAVDHVCLQARVLAYWPLAQSQIDEKHMRFQAVLRNSFVAPQYCLIRNVAF